MGVAMSDRTVAGPASDAVKRRIRLFATTGQVRELVPARKPHLAEVPAQARSILIERTKKKFALLSANSQKAVPGAWPWATAFFGDYYGDDWWDPFCGGSLVASGWVLTAAHCNVTPWDVAMIGENDLAHPVSESIGVERVCTHERYDPATLDFDLALVKLRETVDKTIIPLEETSANQAVPHSDATMIGWGAVTQGGTYSTDLRFAKIPLVSETDCDAAYPAKITSTMLCAGSKSGSGACSGDSGGPLMVSQAADPFWFQIGVTSWGDDCSVSQNFGVYTDVSTLRQWIDDTIAGHNPLCPSGGN